MSAYIPVPNPLTPEWFTAILRQSEILREGRVLSVARETTGSFNSHTSRLLLSYSVEDTSDIPIHLILKQNIAEAWGKEAGIDEVMFYRLVMSLSNHPPIIVPCYGAAYDEQSGDSYLLLRDLSGTHLPPVTRDQQISIVEGVPSSTSIEEVVDCLAQLHAYWWDHFLPGPQAFEVGYWSRNAERFEQYLHRRRTAWERLVTEEQDWLPDDLRELYTHVLAQLPYHWKQYLEPRFHTKKNLTLVHGDAYFANFLCPKNPGSLKTNIAYLLDWQSPSFDVGAYDLVNLCATFWTSEQRNEKQREENTLRRYYAALHELGVSNYSWDELVTDYKTGLIFWLLMPVQDYFDGSHRDYWWPKMRCLVAAFQEWPCEELLDI